MNLEEMSMNFGRVGSPLDERKEMKRVKDLDEHLNI